jgi:myo-inositol-1(or 4)-monophosphatase
VRTQSSVDLAQARTVGIRAVEDAGALLRSHVREEWAVRVKSPTGDVVTDLDVAAEKIIVEHIRWSFPSHRITAEESGLYDAADSSLMWLVDPLDGTNNVAIGLHNYVVGLALCENAVPVLGVVHDPVLGHTWSAVRGAGAWGPAGDLQLSADHQPHHGPVVAWSQGYDVGRDAAAARLRVVLESSSRRLLQLWAPLLAWTLLARGDIDGFVGYRPESIDLPAGALIAQEAGIVVYGFDGFPFEDRIDLPGDRNFVAGPPRMIPDLLAMVRAADQVNIAGLPR